jgi:hypothetical protein
MEFSTSKIFFICLLASLAFMIWTWKSNKFYNQSEQDNFLDGVGGFVSTGALQMKDYNAYISRLLAFTPSLNGPNQNEDRSILVYPPPSDTWLTSYDANIRRLSVETTNKFFLTPLTLYIFTQANFEGRLVMIPFDPLPLGPEHKIHMAATDRSISALFNIYLKPSEEKGYTFSCVVPKDYKITFIFDGTDIPPTELKSGAHMNVSAYSAIFSITIVRDSITTPQTPSQQVTTTTNVVPAGQVMI